MDVLVLLTILQFLQVCLSSPDSVDVNKKNNNINNINKIYHQHDSYHGKKKLFSKRIVGGHVPGPITFYYILGPNHQAHLSVPTWRAINLLWGIAKAVEDGS